MIIIIGTIHETKNEASMFKLLNKYTDNMDNLYWLCEGESDTRQCKSLKDYEIHVITDALFVNMLIMDIKKNDKNNKNNNLMSMFYDRTIELFITIKRLSKNNNQILNIFNNNKINNIYYKNINKLSFDLISQETLKDIENELRLLDIDILLEDLQIIIQEIIKLMLNNNKINKKYHKCIQNFFKTGYECEDVILTDMREHSFLLEIVSFIIENDIKNKNKKNIYVITVGRDHVKFLHEKLANINDNIIRTLYI
jgi:hypothetical protein